MAGLLKKSIDKATGGDSVDSEEVRKEAEKYRLRVTAGPSYDTKTHKPVYVNTDQATFVENDLVKAKIKVRIRGYQGLPKGSKPHSPYFDDPVHEKDQYSIAFSFVPKQDIPCEGSVWGNDFDHPVRDRLPPGFNTAFKIVKEFIDPGLTCDAYADQPWLYGPSLSCWFAFRIGEQVKEGGDFPAPDERNVMRDGGDGSGKDVRDKLGIPSDNEKRRKHFLDKHNREAFTFEKGRCYQGDFYNPYIDFSKFALKLPGFSLGVLKYIDDKSHQLRYVFKSQKTGEVYLNVNFSLLFGKQLENAMAEETSKPSQKSEPEEGVATGAVDDRNGSVEETQDEPQATVRGSDNGSGSSKTEQPKAAPAPSASIESDHRRTSQHVTGGEGIFVSTRRVPEEFSPSTSTDAPPVMSQDNQQSTAEQTTPAREDAISTPQAPEQPQEQPEVSEISNMLAGTSTSDKRGSEPFLFSNSDKPAASGPIKDMLQGTATRDKRNSEPFVLERSDRSG